MAMIAAETLGIPLDNERIRSGDTDLTVDLGANSSRQTLMTGHATKEAPEQVKERISSFLAAALECDPSSIEFKDGVVFFNAGPGNFEKIRTAYIKVKFDSRGQILNPYLGEYRIPTSLNMPNVKSIIVESNEPGGPCGAKEV
jgi:4-hydroxybenzoyl-CoA reductase subunit alpha